MMAPFWFLFIFKWVAVLQPAIGWPVGWGSWRLESSLGCQLRSLSHPCSSFADVSLLAGVCHGALECWLSVYFSLLLVPAINLLPLSCTFSFVAWSVKVDLDPLNTKFVLPGIQSPHPRIPFGFLFPYLYLLSYHCLIILYMKLSSLNYCLLSVSLLDPHCPKNPPLENWERSSAFSNLPCCQPASYKERSLVLFLLQS